MVKHQYKGTSNYLGPCVKTRLYSENTVRTVYRLFEIYSEMRV